MVLGFRKKATAEPVVEETANPGVENLSAGPIETPIGRATGVDDIDFSTESSLDQLKKFKAAHQWDYNLDVDQIEGVNKIVDSGDVEKEANFEHALLEEDSPYFEVRAAVRNYDE